MEDEADAREVMWALAGGHAPHVEKGGLWFVVCEWCGTELMAIAERDPHKPWRIVWIPRQTRKR